MLMQVTMLDPAPQTSRTRPPAAMILVQRAALRRRSDDILTPGLGA